MHVKHRVLVVDDEPETLCRFSEMLRGVGFEVATARCGMHMLHALRQAFPDLLLLDLNLHGEDGLALATDVRRRSAVPLIMMSRVGESADKVRCLEAAADDFIVKPIGRHELLARIHAVLRRCADWRQRAATPPPRVAEPARRYRFGDWLLDVGRRELRDRRGDVCALTHAEYKLLEAFVRHPRRLWTRDELIEETRTIESRMYERSIDVMILRLRRRIEPNPRCPCYIRTERGLGYQFGVEPLRCP